MATVRKLKSKRFLAEVRKNGHYKSKTFDSKVKAMAWAVEKEQYLSDEGLVQGKTLGELLERYRDDITPQKKSHRTEHNRLNKFLRHSLATLPLADVRQSHFDDWIRATLKEIKSSSVNRDLNLWSAVFEQGKRWQWTDRNPIRGIQRPKNPPHRDCRITEDIQDEIVFALGFNGKNVFETRHLIAVAFLFALETAMRQGEIWGLDWKDVHLDQRYVRLCDTHMQMNAFMLTHSRQYLRNIVQAGVSLVAEHSH